MRAKTHKDNKLMLLPRTLAAVALTLMVSISGFSAVASAAFNLNGGTSKGNTTYFQFHCSNGGTVSITGGQNVLSCKGSGNKVIYDNQLSSPSAYQPSNQTVTVVDVICPGNSSPVSYSIGQVMTQMRCGGNNTHATFVVNSSHKGTNNTSGNPGGSGNSANSGSGASTGTNGTGNSGNSSTAGGSSPAPQPITAPIPAAKPDPAIKCNSQVNGSCCTQSQCDLVARYLTPAINVLAAIFGLVSVISIVLGGINYTTSEGDPQKASRAKSRITNTIIAVIAFLFLYSFLQFLVPGGIFNK